MFLWSWFWNGRSYNEAQIAWKYNTSLYVSLSGEGPSLETELETLDFIFRIWAVPRASLYISLYVSTLPTQQTTFTDDSSWTKIVVSPGHTAYDNDAKKNRSPIKCMLAVTLLRYV